MIPIPLGAVAAALAIALAGCAPDAYTDRDNVAGTVSSFLRDCAAGDSSLAIENLDTAAREAFSTGATTLASCKRVVPLGVRAITDPGALGGAPVAVAAIDGVHATAIATVAGRRLTVPLVQIYGDWFISLPGQAAT